MPSPGGSLKEAKVRFVRVCCWVRSAVRSVRGLFGRRLSKQASEPQGGQAAKMSAGHYSEVS